VGKHQNAMAEINPLYISENGIKVIRRLSGGGAVYHDSGNLNFSFHKTVGDLSKVRYSDFTVPVVEVLNRIGIPAEINSRNDIVINGIKVSGHAQHVFRNRVLSHGTLLINSDLEKLSASLKKSLGIYESKAIQSVRSKVSNIFSFSNTEISVGKMIDLLVQYNLQQNSNSEIVEITTDDVLEIQKLVSEKYTTWEWNFGYSPAYRFQNEIELESGTTISCKLSVERGIIIDAIIGGNMFSFPGNEDLINKLTGQFHTIDAIRKFIESDQNMLQFKDRLIQLLF
jgi:lipoate---protein ligase